MKFSPADVGSYAFDCLNFLGCIFVAGMTIITSDMTIIRDILMGLMKRLVRLRASNLKVLVTSATLDGDKVSKFFSDCPILTIPGKLYPVEIFYSTERPTSYVESSLKTAIGMT